MKLPSLRSIFPSTGNTRTASGVDSSANSPVTVEDRLRQTGYQDRIANELRNHSGIFNAHESDEEIRRFSWKVGAFEHSMRCYSPYLQSKMPNVALDPYVLDRMQRAERPLRMLALGCATGDWELKLAQQAPGKCEVTMVDLNAELLAEGQRYGEKHGLKVNVVAGDVNTFDIAREYYDFIVCRSSLHHFIMLEKVLEGIREGLAPAGNFLILGEWIGRNGLQIYPETEIIANAIFSILPDRLRLNKYTGQIDKRHPNIDHSVDSFEAVRSEEILPKTLEVFEPVEYVAYDTLVTLFFDFRYGSNYNLDDAADRELVERLTALDIEYLEEGILRPTAMCGIFKRPGS